ncbi:unnamed protein product [Merluccius merluccius]
MKRIYESGSQKKKKKDQRQEFIAKLPKLSSFFTGAAVAAGPSAEQEPFALTGNGDVNVLPVPVNPSGSGSGSASSDVDINQQTGVHRPSSRTMKTFTVKALSTTRWECRIEAVKAVRDQFPDILKALTALEDHAKEKRDAEVASSARGIFKEMQT